MSRIWTLWWLAFGAVASVACTVSSKAAGGVWLALVLLGLGAAFERSPRAKPPAGADHGHALWASAVFLGVCALALGLRSVGMLHWGDHWNERHAELRLLFMAVAVWVGVGKGWFDGLALLTHGFALACLLGWLHVWRVGREHLTIHPIAWAVGVALLSIWLLHSALWRAEKGWHRWFWLLGGVCGVLAVLSSQSRGAFGVVLWWLAVLLLQAWASRRQGAALTSRAHVAAVLGLFCALALALWGTGLWQRPAAVLQQAVTEFEMSQTNTEAASETSFGARLYMWQRAVPAVAQAPVWGYGQEGRRELIHQWGRDVDSHVVQSLGHAHNQYLNDLLDNGVWGLASGLTYVLGLGGLALGLIRRGCRFAGATIGGVVFMHATASLSNVNFAHNYYPTVMAVVVGLALIQLDLKSGHLEQPLFKV